MSEIIKSRLIREERTSLGSNQKLGFEYELTINVDAVKKELVSIEGLINKKSGEGDNAVTENIGWLGCQHGECTVRVTLAHIDALPTHSEELKRFVNSAIAGIKAGE